MKRLLPERLEYLGIGADPFRGGELAAPVRRMLIEAGLAQTAPAERMRSKPTLAFVDAVNIELTYRCNTSCPHCLQQNIRHSVPSATELSTDAVEKAIHDTWFCGLAQKGINLTGGEPLFFRPDIIRIIQYCRSLGVRVRLNTNNWWGRALDFRIGEHSFESAGQFVRFVRECGLTIFAFSFDNRVEHDPNAFENLAGAVAACETNQFAYQMICTGPSNIQMMDYYNRIVARIGAPPQFMIPVMMEEIDIGGAASSSATGDLDANSVCRLVHNANCKGRGFYRPSLLHITPAGGVRTCYYAISMANLGNINELSLMEMVNRFPSNPVAMAFQDAQLEEYARRLFQPHARKYRAFYHPCTACALLGRLIEGYHSNQAQSGREPNDIEVEEINVRAGRELNLLNEK